MATAVDGTSVPRAANSGLASTLTMPSGFVLPVYKITRIRDGLSTWSTRQGGVAEIARFYGEEKKSFHAQLKTGWGRQDSQSRTPVPQLPRGRVHGLPPAADGGGGRARERGAGLGGAQLAGQGGPADGGLSGTAGGADRTEAHVRILIHF